MSRTALVIGSGPNGLSAAIVLARAGFQVEVHEAAARLGGAAGSAELTLPGFLHDVGSAVHPFGVASPFFQSLPLQIRWIHPPVPLAHPFDNGSAGLVHRDLETTAQNLAADARTWTSIFRDIVRDWDLYRNELLAPLGPTRHPFAMAKIGMLSAWPAARFIERFRTETAKALFLGMAAHYPYVRQFLSSGFGITLGASAQTTGWPIPEGGAQSIANALAAHLRSIGGVIHTNSPVDCLDPRYTLVMADTSPAALARIAGAELPLTFRCQLEKYRYGPAAYKVDWALSQPIPWRAPECAQAGTLHLGGTAREILLSEDAAIHNRHASPPFLLLSQPTLFDASRAPAGRHIAWAYCHVPNGSTVDRTADLESQIERFAPGFRDCILARHVSPPLALQSANANLVGGEATGGVADWRQLLFRPTWRRYGTPNPRIWLCSSSTPPGAGVHGMCGFHAATRALQSVPRIAQS